MTARVENTGLTLSSGRIGWRIVLPALAVLLAASSWFCVAVLRVGGTRGTVGIVENIDAPQGSWRVVPAANTDVLILWQAREFNRSIPRLRCIRAVLTQTNASGEYSIGSWWIAPRWPLLTDAVDEVHIFRPGHLPIVDRSQLPRNLPYTDILGPPAVNPWTGNVLPDEDPLDPLRDRFCPDVERL